MGFWDCMEDCFDWVYNNRKNIAMGVAAASIIVVGICVTVFAAPLLSAVAPFLAAAAPSLVAAAPSVAAAAPFLSAVAGSALIGAGVSGLMCALSKKATWTEFAKNMGKGALIGAVSGLFSWGASTLIANHGLTGISTLLVNCSVRIVVAMGSSFVTNGINNKMNGKDFTHNWTSALLSGLIIGVIGAVAEGFRYFNAKTAAEQANNLLRTTTRTVSELKDKFCHVVDSYAGNAKWVVYSALEMGKVLAEGAVMQFLTTGKVDWKMVLIGGAIYGATRIARTAYDYRQKQNNDKHINEGFDDHEKKHEQNVKDAKEHPKKTKNTKIQTCTAKLKDSKGNVTTGRNAGQRRHDGEMKEMRNEERSAYDHEHLSNPHRDNLSKRFNLKKGDDHVHNGVTTRMEQGGPRPMTDAEARLALGNNYEKRDNACAECEAVVRADNHNQGKTDLSKSVIITVGTDYVRDQQTGEVISSLHKIKPPCNNGCSEIKFEKNFAQSKDLADQILRRQVSGEQTYIDVRRQKSDDGERASTSRVSYNGKPFFNNQDYPSSDDDDDKPSTDNQNYPPSSKEDFPHDTVCKVTAMKKLFAKSDDILATLEEELHWQSKLKITYEKKKEEEDKLKNDDFIRNNIIKQENVYAKSSSGGQEIRAGTSKEPMAGEAYSARQLFSKKMKKKDEKDESKKGFWEMKNEQNKPKAAINAEQRIVETFPIVAWSEKRNKYMMVDHNNWPKPIEGMTKMIAFLGVHKCGRTTLLHSLIYKAGYKMTKEQSLITKLGLGINMYVLRELGLIFLDICDSIDMIGDLQKDTTPLGNALLETFGYVNCDHLIYSLPFGENDDGLHQTKADDGKMTTQDAIDYINSRVKLLFIFSNQMLNFAGAMRITVVPRWEYIKGETCDKWRELEKHFEEMRTRVEMIKLVDRREDGTPLSDEERFGHLTEEDVLLGAKHHTVILPVRFFQPGRSVNEDGFYRSELERLWKSVENDTGAHPSSLGIDEMAETSVYGSMITTWNRLVENKEITTCLAEVNNEKTLKEARGEDGAQNAVEIYYNRLQNYLKEIPPDCSLAHAIEKYVEEREKKSKEYERALEGERDPETFFRLLLKSGTILIRECLQMTDGNLKEKGLGIGLSVFSTLLGQGNKIMDIRLLRLGIVDLDLIKLLNNPLIYMHYHEAWIIFYFMAGKGFRFHLLEVPLWDALREILTRNDELIPVKMKIYHWALHTLMSMMNLDEIPLFPPEENVGRLNDKKSYLPSNQRIQLDYDYRLYSEEHVERLFADTVNYNKKERDGIASDNYDKLIAMAEEFYNGHEICKKTSLLFEDLHISCRDQFASVTLNHFHKQCAIYFAQGLFDKKVAKVLKQKGKEGSVEEIALRLKVLRAAVVVMTRDKKLVPLLVDSGLHDWLLDEFLADKKGSFSIYCHAAAIASHIMFTQSSLGIGKLPKEVSNTKINTLDDVRPRERRELQVKSYGAYRLQLLEANCHELAVRKLHGFFDGGLPAGDISSATMLLNFIIRLIVSTIDEEDRKRFADFFIIQKREMLINQMERLVDLCADKVNFKQIDATKSQLSAVESAMELVNRLIWSCYANNVVNFFDLKNPELLNSVTSIMRRVFEKVVVPLLTARERLPKNVEKSLQSLHLEFVCLSLNVSTVSGISFTDVKHKLGQDKVGTLGSLMEKNPRQKNDNPEILLKMDDLTKLKPNEPGYDLSNVQRAAYIINNSDRNIYSQFKGLVQTMVKTAQNLKTKEEEAQRLLESATTRRERLEALEKRTVASDGPSYADRMKSEDEPSTSSAPKKITLACDGVFMKTTLLGNFSLPRKDFEDLLFGKLVEVQVLENRKRVVQVYDLDIAYAYMLLLMNNSDEGRQNLDKFLQYLKNLLDSHEDQMIKSDEPFLSLHWMSRVLSYLGYWSVKEVSRETWFAPPGIKSKERGIVYNTMKEYLPLQREVALKLDTTFKEVKEVTETSYQSQTLPEEFFSSLDTAIQKSLKEKTVVELVKNKWELKEVNYILVRVEVSSGGPKRVYQAVFNRYMSVSSVLESLRDKKIAVSSLKLTLTSPPLDPSRSLGNIGAIAIYLYEN